MSTQNTSPSMESPMDPPMDPPMVPMHVENSTDATRGEPLAIRAQKRRAELEQALEDLPTDDTVARNYISIALSVVDELLAGDVEHLSHVTAADLNRWLESSKHLAEAPPTQQS